MATITLTIPDGNAIQNDARTNKLQKIASIPADDLDLLAQIAENPKARAALKKNWSKLKMLAKL